MNRHVVKIVRIKGIDGSRKSQNYFSFEDWIRRNIMFIFVDESSTPRNNIKDKGNGVRRP